MIKTLESSSHRPHKQSDLSSRYQRRSDLHAAWESIILWIGCCRSLLCAIAAVPCAAGARLCAAAHCGVCVRACAVRIRARTASRVGCRDREVSHSSFEFCPRTTGLRGTRKTESSFTRCCAAQERWRVWVRTLVCEEPHLPSTTFTRHLQQGWQQHASNPR
jgi:hypothetical protein